jgi:hypothetical protein
MSLNPGRPAVLSAELVAQLRAKREAGESLAQIARELNELGTPTAHAGAQWWPSRVRAVLDRVTDRAQNRRKQNIREERRSLKRRLSAADIAADGARSLPAFCGSRSSCRAGNGA